MLAQVAQGSGDITIPKSDQKPFKCGTWGHGSVEDLAVLSQGLDSMIFDVFSNLNDSMAHSWRLKSSRCWSSIISGTEASKMFTEPLLLYV